MHTERKDAYERVNACEEILCKIMCTFTQTPYTSKHRGR